MSHDPSSPDSKGTNRDVFRFFDPKIAGRTLKEVGVDYLKMESRDVKTRWFHGEPGTDLFLWMDPSDEILKQQVSFHGLIVEWSIVDGLRTGMVIEEDSGQVDIKASEIIRFDEKVQNTSVDYAIETVRWVEGLEPAAKAQLIENFENRTIRDTLKATWRDQQLPSPIVSGQKGSSPSFWKKVLAFFKRR